MDTCKQAKILTASQQNRVLKHLENSRYPLRNRVLFLLSFKAGLEAKEIAHLTWAMVLGEDGNVADSIYLEKLGSRKERVIPINGKLHEALQRLLVQRRAQKSFRAKDRVVCTERSDRTSAQAVINFFHNLYKAVGLQGCSFHSGRRTFITGAARAMEKLGGNLNDVRLLAGHATLTATQRYVDCNIKIHRQIVEQL
jgi:integrase/recombinase XerD